MANNTDALLTPSMPSLSEQAVLGSMLIDADCVKDVMGKLQPQDFYLKQNREIFETIYSMFIYSRPIDGVTVAREMEKAGVYHEDTRAYLLQLMEVTPTSANVMESPVSFGTRRCCAPRSRALRRTRAFAGRRSRGSNMRSTVWSTARAWS